MKVRRYDRAQILKAHHTDEGFLVAPATLTRTGLLEYLNDDGTIRKELRLPGDVFAQDSLASYALKPVTLDHPGRVSSENAKRHTVGVLSAASKAADGIHVDGQVVIYDAETIKAVESGKRQLSPGYDADLEPVPGRMHVDSAGELGPAGTVYEADFYQRNIRANHLAIVRVARAGASATIRLDSAGNELADQEDKEIRTMKIKIGSTEVDVPDTVGAEIDRLRKDAAEAEKAKAERDVLEAQAKDRQARLDSFEKEAAEKAKAELVKQAHAVLGGKAEELLKLDAADIKKRVIAKLSPSMKLDGKGEIYMEAAFDALMSTPPKKEQRHDTAAAAAAAALDAKTTSEEHEDGADDFVAKARANYEASIRDAWKTTPTAKA